MEATEGTSEPIQAQSESSELEQSQAESESLLAHMDSEDFLTTQDPTTVTVAGRNEQPNSSQSQVEESQSLLHNYEDSTLSQSFAGHAAINNSEDMFKSYDGLDNEPVVPESNQEMEIEEEANEIQESEEVVQEETEEPEDLDEILETEEPHEIDEDAGNDDENEASSTTNLPIGRVKKIMKICIQTNDDSEDVPVVANANKKGKKGKGSKDVPVVVSTSKLILTKEAIYLTAAATELFVAAVTQHSSRITTATKKKTVTNVHLKQALGDSECFEFLQGCFQPSLID